MDKQTQTDRQTNEPTDKRLENNQTADQSDNLLWYATMKSHYVTA